MGEAEVSIRRAKSRDMAFIVELWKKLSEEHAQLDERYALRPEAEIVWARWAGQRLRDDASIALVAESGTECVGYLLGHADEAQPIFEQRSYATITDLFVTPDFRRKGVASKLLAEALAFFKSRDLAHVRLNVLVKDEAARAFYEKHGFGDFLYRMWKSI
ncbi:MAG: GNAT family N-acetyltransferase [Planctomycetota bacterium]|jgi:ribosomal protein S18 acetylase RimI-like enzyme